MKPHFKPWFQYLVFKKNRGLHLCIFNFKACLMLGGSQFECHGLLGDSITFAPGLSDFFT